MREMHDVLRREIKALAFDQYGTIVDMQTGLTEAVALFLKQKGWDGKPNDFVTWWRRTHFENSMIDALCDRGHTPYRQIGHRAVSYVMDRFISSRTGRLMRKRKRSLVMIVPASCLLPIMPSIALAQNLMACGPRSSTAASGHLAKHHISLISL